MKITRLWTLLVGLLMLMGCESPPAVSPTAAPPPPTDTPLPDEPAPTETPPYLSLTETYVNETYGFAIDYPAGFTVDEFEVAPGRPAVLEVSFVGPYPPSTAPDNTISLGISVMPKEPAVSLDEFAQRMPLSAVGTTIVDPQPITTQSGVTGRVQFEDGSTGQSMRVYLDVAYFAREEMMLVLSTRSPDAEEVALRRPLHRAMADTFRLTGPVATE